MAEKLTVLELFAGIGGCAAAIAGNAEIVTAVETAHDALTVYRHNFVSPTLDQPVESLPENWFREFRAAVWWMSPPVLPFVNAGLRRELDDPRAKALLHVIEQIHKIRPRYVALECVPTFDKSLTRQLLLETLADSGYKWQETQLCPTSLGVPNQRRRYYLVAGREEILPWKPLNSKPRFSLRSTLDRVSLDELVVVPELLATHRDSMHIVDANDSAAVSSCFTPDYGRSVKKTGSYLQTSGCVRHFSPAEILLQLGFPLSFTLPDNTSREQAWRLVGNSLSVPATRYILEAIPGLVVRRSRIPDVGTI
ncbi:MAG: DNA cytosine methyltransferase [Planctomycetaceae bacterium]|nr:DNA cytosine methyltransferase [Planctomycetales bacterium]MCB9921929.1 DNA cytosine methyltransferase [Planctomycetaceae bacterium]